MARPRLVPALAVAVVVLAVSAPPTSARPGPSPEAPGRALAPHAPRELLVAFRQGRRARAANAAIGARLLGRAGSARRVRLPEGVRLADALAYYRGRPDVRYAEPNYLVTLAALPDDPRFPEQWSLKNTGDNPGSGGTGTPDADIDANQAWDLTTGSRSIVVGVVDTGIDYTHPDLAANVFRNPGECDGDGLDDDSNGYVDDCHGIDTGANDSDPMDLNGHGTHVAGIIGAVGDNGQGIAGVAWRVRLLACKPFTDPDGFGSSRIATVADAVECLDYIRSMKERDFDVVAVNASWTTASSHALYDAIRDLMESDILFVTSSGNGASDNDRVPFYPANYFLPNIVSVTSTATQDNVDPFANVGRRTVHLGAPGDSILSTIPGDYGRKTGTSQAAPHVAGVAALLEAQRPARKWVAIRNLILAGGDVKDGLRPTTVTGRRLNANGSLRCSDRHVVAPLRPLPFVGGGARETIAVLNIVCARPAGPISVQIDGGSALPLRDDGAGADLAANDGIYSRSWTPPGPCAFGRHVLTFTGGKTTSVRIGGPHGSYDCEVVPFAWRSITGTKLDLFVSPNRDFIDPPFPVSFGGTTYDEVTASLYGLLAMGHVAAPAPLPFRNEPLPAAVLPPALAPFWSVLQQPAPGSNQAVYWQVIGASPNRELVVEWRDVTLTGAQCDHDTSQTVRFQVVVSEASDDILFSYDDAAFGGEACDDFDFGGHATIGVQPGVTNATQVGFDVPVLRDDMTIRFSPA